MIARATLRCCSLPVLLSCCCSASADEYRAAAFSSLRTPPLLLKTSSARPTTRTTSLFYKTIDPIEDERISSSPSSPNPNDRGDKDGTQIIADDIAAAAAAVEDQIMFEEEDDDLVVEEKNDIISATRTLGSLFLRQKDADRVDNINDDDVAGNYDGGDFSSPFGLGEKNSLAQYLLKLKLQEEDNKERAAERRHSRVGKPGKPMETSTLAQNVSMSRRMKIDQKRAKELDESVSKLYISEVLASEMTILPSNYDGDDTSIGTKNNNTHTESGRDILRL